MSDRSKEKKMRWPALASRSCCEPGTMFLEPTPPPGPPGGGGGGASGGGLLQAASNSRTPSKPINFECISIPLDPYRKISPRHLTNQGRPSPVCRLHWGGYLALI